MKKYLIIFLIFLLTVPAMSKTLTGGVVYTVESAREAAFDGIEYEISMEPFKKYHQDPGFISAAKKEGGRPKVSKRGRRVQFFSSGEYGVKYYGQDVIYYYSNTGNLKSLEFRKRKNYPYISVKYDITGALLGVCLLVSNKESFVFTPNKVLHSHWKNNKCYDVNGNVVMKRF